MVDGIELEVGCGYRPAVDTGACEAGGNEVARGSVSSRTFTSILALSFGARLTGKRPHHHDDGCGVV
jgi:hypothetical protein